jgi:hypothetical protein
MAYRDDERLEPADLDAKVCPTCHRDLPAWQDDCPQCREPATLRFSVLGPALPAVPAHLREQDAEAGAHKEQIEPFAASSPDALPIAPVDVLLGGPHAAGGATGGGGCGDGGC